MFGRRAPSVPCAETKGRNMQGANLLQMKPLESVLENKWTFLNEHRLGRRGWGTKECMELLEEHLVQLKNKTLKKKKKENQGPGCVANVVML